MNASENLFHPASRSSRPVRAGKGEHAIPNEQDVGHLNDAELACQTAEDRAGIESSEINPDEFA